MGCRTKAQMPRRPRAGMAGVEAEGAPEAAAGRTRRREEGPQLLERKKGGSQQMLKEKKEKKKFLKLFCTNHFNLPRVSSSTPTTPSPPFFPSF